MDRTSLATIALSLACVALPACLEETRQGDDEPPLRLVVELDGVKFDADIGSKIEVELDGKKVAMTVELKPTRRFAAAGIAFEFPTGMSYTFESDDDLDMWTLDGDSCLIMVQRLEAGDAADLAEIVLDEILAGNESKARKPKSIELQLGKQQRKALRSKAEHDDYSESWTACGINAQGRPVILLLQELLEEDGSSTGEMQGLLDLLAKTFALTQ